MSSFTLTSQAKADLKDIGRNTVKKWGRDQRNHYFSMLDNCFR